MVLTVRGESAEIFGQCGPLVSGPEAESEKEQWEGANEQQIGSEVEQRRGAFEDLAHQVQAPRRSSDPAQPACLVPHLDKPPGIQRSQNGKYRVANCRVYGSS